MDERSSAYLFRLLAWFYLRPRALPVATPHLFCSLMHTIFYCAGGVKVVCGRHPNLGLVVVAVVGDFTVHVDSLRQTHAMKKVRPEGKVLI